MSRSTTSSRRRCAGRRSTGRRDWPSKGVLPDREERRAGGGGDPRLGRDRRLGPGHCWDYVRCALSWQGMRCAPSSHWRSAPTPVQTTPRFISHRGGDPVSTSPPAAHSSTATSGRPPRSGGRVPDVLLLARLCLGACLAGREEAAALMDELVAARERRRALRRGDRPEVGRVPRQPAAGPRPPRARERGRLVRWHGGRAVILPARSRAALLGTVVLTTGSRLAQQLGWTRMDIPLLLGTVFTPSRSRASVIGYAIHFANGGLEVLARLRPRFRGHRPRRLALRTPPRRGARGLRGRRSAERAPARRPSPHGEGVDGRALGTTARAARLPPRQLRPRDPGRDLRAAPGLRRDRRAIRLARSLERPIERQRGVQQPDVREGLGEVADETAFTGVVLLRAAGRGRSGGPGAARTFPPPPRTGPAGRGCRRTRRNRGRSPLAGRQAVHSLRVLEVQVAEDESVRHQLLPIASRVPLTRGSSREKADERDRQQARVEQCGAEVLHKRAQSGSKPAGAPRCGSRPADAPVLRRAVRPNSSISRRPRSNATQAMTLEWVK